MISIPVPKIGAWGRAGGRACAPSGGAVGEGRGERHREEDELGSRVHGVAALAQGSPGEASRSEVIGRKTLVPRRATLRSSLRFLRSGTVA